MTFTFTYATKSNIFLLNQTFTGYIKKLNHKILGVRYYVTHKNENFELSIKDHLKINTKQIPFPKGKRKFQLVIQDSITSMQFIAKII